MVTLESARYRDRTFTINLNKAADAERLNRVSSVREQKRTAGEGTETTSGGGLGVKTDKRDQTAHPAPTTEN